MKELDKVEQSVLRDAIRDLNNSGLIDKPIKMVGVKKEVLIKNFTDAVENVPDEKSTKIPNSAVNLYNDLFEDEAEEAPKEDEVPEDEIPEDEAPEDEIPEDEAPEDEPKDEKEKQEESPVKRKRGRPASKEPKEKKETPPKDPNAPKRKPPERKGPKGPFGSFLDGQAGKIEVALAEGGTIEDIMEAAGASRARIASHIRYLKEKKNIEVVKGEDGIYKVV